MSTHPDIHNLIRSGRADDAIELFRQLYKDQTTLETIKKKFSDIKMAYLDHTAPDKEFVSKIEASSGKMASKFLNAIKERNHRLVYNTYNHIRLGSNIPEAGDRALYTNIKNGHIFPPYPELEQFRFSMTPEFAELQQVPAKEKFNWDLRNGRDQQIYDLMMHTLRTSTNDELGIALLTVAGGMRPYDISKALFREIGQNRVVMREYVKNPSMVQEERAFDLLCDAELFIKKMVEFRNRVEHLSEAAINKRLKRALDTFIKNNPVMQQASQGQPVSVKKLRYLYAQLLPRLVSSQKMPENVFVRVNLGHSLHRTRFGNDVYLGASNPTMSLDLKH